MNQAIVCCFGAAWYSPNVLKVDIIDFREEKAWDNVRFVLGLSEVSNMGWTWMYHNPSKVYYIRCHPPETSRLLTTIVLFFGYHNMWASWRVSQPSGHQLWNWESHQNHHTTIGSFPSLGGQQTRMSKNNHINHFLWNALEIPLSPFPPAKKKSLEEIMLSARLELDSVFPLGGSNLLPWCQTSVWEKKDHPWPCIPTSWAWRTFSTHSCKVGPH